MKKVAEELKMTIELFKSDYLDLDEALTDFRISEDKWTLKEIVGHLIDSASNNHQRFIRLKLSDEIEFPDYRNGEWLQIQNHNDMKFSDLLLLFFYYNRLMTYVILSICEESLDHRWNIAWDENSTFITLERLANHYVDHIKKHMTHFKERLNEVENMRKTNVS
jgi:hypothetical protein